MEVRILVIEDDSTNMELMLFLLKSFGYQPIMAFVGLTGIELARTIKPAMILCDISLPGLSGIGVVRQLKGSDDLHHIPVIAVTAMTMAGDERHILNAGFDGYVAKPFDASELRKVLALHLG